MKDLKLYQIQGYVEFQERPNVEIIFEDEELSEAMRVYNILTTQDLTNEIVITQLTNEGNCVEDIHRVRLIGILESKLVYE
jgi:hypothetical protein